MDGITDCIYRTITKEVFDKYTINPEHKLRTWTEFMNADGYMINPQRLVQHLVYNDSETNVIAQIYGWNEDTLVKTAIDIQRKYPGFAGIELNIWCPSPKVMACGAGSGMLRDKKNCLSIIKSISESIDMPFSIKTRAGLTNDDKEDQFEFLLEASKYCYLVGIHGRVFKQGHSWDVDRDMIGRVKKAVGDDCLIIWNWGVKTYEDHLILTEKYKIDGIMSGQAAIANPRLFVDHEPTAQDRYEIIVRHMKLLAAYEIYFNANIWPLFSTKQLVINRRRHADSNEDTKWKALEDIDFHDYFFPMPSLVELEWIADNLDKYNLGELRSCVEFRKYLFNYVKWLKGSKELKVKVAQIRDYPSLFEAIDGYFVG